MTLREIVIAWPGLIPNLEARGIDYCSGGGSSFTPPTGLGWTPTSSQAPCPLTSQCEPSQTQRRTASNATMAQFAHHVEQTHHVLTRAALDRLEVLVAKWVAAHAGGEPRLIELHRTVAALTEDAPDHFVREERVLFPWFRRLERRTEIQGGPPWSMRRPIACMAHDHDDVGAELAYTS